MIAALLVLTSITSLNNPLSLEGARLISRKCNTPISWLSPDQHGHVFFRPGRHASAAQIACLGDRIRMGGIQVTPDFDAYLGRNRK